MISFQKLFDAYSSLNIQYVKNLMDLGVSLTRSFTKDQTDSEEPEEKQEPAFVLQGEGKSGDKIVLQFVLDNSKIEEVNCTLINSRFRQIGKMEEVEFDLLFSPQVFLLMPGASQTVDIHISIPTKTEAAIYHSHVQVKGFEPAYFSIQISVI